MTSYTQPNIISSIQLFQLRLSDKSLKLKTRPKGNMGSS